MEKLYMPYGRTSAPYVVQQAFRFAQDYKLLILGTQVDWEI